ncbi:MAG: type VI secretion system protein TssA [Gammaproteobacteria bacterium]|nr:type VI secretion system protein TssA [Gammaproteobacteria bacterium]
MPSPALIDVESLVNPISDENSVGADIRQDSSPASLYNQIKDARSAARAAERHSLFDGDNSEAMSNWYKIIDLAPEILQNHAKDLEVASWLTEALIRRAGFQGLRDGFAVIRGLIDNYWDSLYPLPDEEDGMETRLASLTGLNGEGAEGVLIAPIRNVTITEGGEPGPFSFWQYKQALDIQKIADEDTRSKKAGKIGYTLEDIENAVASTDAEFYINLCDDVSISINEYREISRALDNLCGTHESPPTSNIINTLEDALSVLKHVARFKLPVESSNEDDMGQDVTDINGTSVAGSSGVPAGAIKTREEAFRHLKNIANYFRKTEPHSPISYIIDKAVRWGDMDLDELMRELIPDSSSRDYYSSLTGVKTDES